MTYESSEEVIWSLADRHLDFSVSVMAIFKEKVSDLHHYDIYVMSAVRYNNKWGRVYFFCIKGIHSYVVKTMTKKMLVKL